MAEKLTMTALSPTMEQGTIMRWLKKEGDAIAAGDILCEVETDKATMDYEASSDGYLLKILLGEGETGKVGDAIAIVGGVDEDISALIAQKSASISEPQANVANEEEQRTTSPPKKEAVPQVAQQGPAPGRTGTASGRADADSEAGRRVASPLARKLAGQGAIDLSLVPGSGPGGRIVKRDIEQFQAKQATAEPQRAPLRSITSQEEEIRQPLSAVRRVIAERLSVAKSNAPHYYLTVSVNADRIFAARSRLNDERKGSLGFNAFLLKLAAMALLRHPKLHATLDKDEIVYHPRVDIGLAVALEDGLIAPVVRDVARKGIQEIDIELKNLIQRAFEGRLTPEEYSGATFTISNHEC